MDNLSPPAKAVLDAATFATPGFQSSIAAAIHAVADQVVPREAKKDPAWQDSAYRQRVNTRAFLLAIAEEIAPTPIDKHPQPPSLDPMTHPIHLPPELFAEWWSETSKAYPQMSGAAASRVVIKAVEWAADAQLEKCCEWLKQDLWPIWSIQLRAAMRPKPPSLKEQALKAFERVNMLWATDEFGEETLDDLDVLRRAIKSIPDAIE